MKKYLSVMEKTPTGFSAYSPDMDGCVCTGATREEVQQNMGRSYCIPGGWTAEGRTNRPRTAYSFCLR
jgi:hypothetical protein